MNSCVLSTHERNYESERGVINDWPRELPVKVERTLRKIAHEMPKLMMKDEWKNHD